MLPHSQQQQNLDNIRRIALRPPAFLSKFGRLSREGISPEQLATQSSQSGFTIVEALLAIIVVSILMTAVAPVLVLATANRVQAKRVETAVNAAQYYISVVRSDPEVAPPMNDANLSNNRRNNSSVQYFGSVDPPRGGGNLVCNVNARSDGYCISPAGPKYKLFCVDGDGDNRCTSNSLKDMLVQAFAYQSEPPTTGESDAQRATRGYQLGIRVYRADAFKDSGSLKNSSNTFTNQTKALARTNTAGLGDRKAPLVEMTAQIVPEDAKYKDLCEQIGGCQ